MSTRIVGVPREIKTHEYRVGLVPESVRELTRLGHTVLVEHNAGAGIGVSDEAYQNMGARIVPDAETLFGESELIVKVKEPQPQECKRLTKKHTLFTFLHLAPDRVQAELLLASGCTAIAYETVSDAQGRLPLLAPMSEVAGRMSVQMGASGLEKPQGGRGVLLGGVPGVMPAKVLVLGAGVVGSQAARIAIGMQATVIVMDNNINKLRAIDDQYGVKVRTAFYTQDALEKLLPTMDLVIGAVLIPGGSAPKLIRKSHLAMMQKGSVLVDVSIDQGGCFESSRPTTFEKPSYVEGGVVHYAVSNMPGAAPYTSAYALNNATLPYVLKLASLGTNTALRSDTSLLLGLNVFNGAITHPEVAKALDLPLQAF